MLTALRRVEHESGVSTALHLIDRLARRAGNVSWFGNVGATLAHETYHDATVYARLLGIGHSHPAKPMGWNAAVRIASGPDAVAQTECDATEGNKLRAAAHLRHIPDLVDAVICDAAKVVSDAALADAASMAANDAIRDGTIARSAGKSAARAFELAALALAAGEVHHRFILSLRLFAAGHWPLPSGERLWVF